MKKLSALLLAAFTLVGLQGIAQWKKVKGNGKQINNERSVGSFHTIAVSGSMEVLVSKGATGKLRVQADENLQEYIITEVKDGVLSIHTKDKVSISTNDMKVYVPANMLDGVKIAGSGSVTSNEAIASSGKFAASIAGSGNIRFQTSARDLKASIAGSGNMDIGGTTNKLDVSISGSGSFKGYNLKTQEADIAISGSGDVETTVNGMIDARISGSGDVYYKGQAQVSFKSAGSGRIRKVD